MINAKLIRKLAAELRTCERIELKASESDAPIGVSWRLAARTDAARRRLYAARAGIAPVLPNTKKNRARVAFAALASIGRAIARAFTTKASLAKAQATLAARKAARLVRASVRRAVAVVATVALSLMSATTINASKEITMTIETPTAPEPQPTNSTAKTYGTLVAGDFVGSHEVDFVVPIEMGFVRVYWCGLPRPTQQPATAPVELLAINGYPVIAKTRVPRTRNGKQGFIVIVDRGDHNSEHAPARYVTSLWFDGEESWAQGHYCCTREGADEEARDLVDLYNPDGRQRRAIEAKLRGRS